MKKFIVAFLVVGIIVGVGAITKAGYFNPKCEECHEKMAVEHYHRDGFTDYICESCGWTVTK